MSRGSQPFVQSAATDDGRPELTAVKMRSTLLIDDPKIDERPITEEQPWLLEDADGTV